jgi:hypothetical protein
MPAIGRAADINLEVSGVRVYPHAASPWRWRGRGTGLARENPSLPVVRVTDVAQCASRAAPDKIRRPLHWCETTPQPIFCNIDQIIRSSKASPNASRLAVRGRHDARPVEGGTSDRALMELEAVSLRLAASHTLAVPSREAVTMRAPSGLKSACRSSASVPCTRATKLCVSASAPRAVLVVWPARLSFWPPVEDRR